MRDRVDLSVLVKIERGATSAPRTFRKQVQTECEHMLTGTCKPVTLCKHSLAIAPQGSFSGVANSYPHWRNKLEILQNTEPLHRKEVPGCLILMKVMRCMRSFSASSSRVGIHPWSLFIVRSERKWRIMPAACGEYEVNR
jgi:hypothetical protein